MNSDEQKIQEVAQVIKGFMPKVLADPEDPITYTKNAKEEVLQRFQPIFTKEHAIQITKEEFLSFLLMSNNKHWAGLHRKGPQITKDMEALRNALNILLDESLPLQNRLEQLGPGGEARIRNFARAYISSILTVAFPNKYGVLNNITEGGMKAAGIWPDFERGANFAAKYIVLNEIMNKIADSAGIDLWTLDACWHRVIDIYTEQEEEHPLEQFEELDETPQARFGLERHLHDFLRDNWDRVEELSEWLLYEEDGDQVGYEYPTNIGFIDLLGRHKEEDKWLVIELKRGQSSDQTVGQILRYMGWVQDRLAEEGEEIEGLIISHSAHQKLDYALRFVNNVSYLLYEVKFELREPKK